MASHELSHLERRRAMAEILSQVLEVATEKYGRVAAETLVAESVQRSAIVEGQKFAQGAPDKGLKEFSKILDTWTVDGALEIELLRSDEHSLDFNVVRCRYAELYQSMGLGQIGRLFSCERDGVFCKGFNPDIELRRTQTIMEGANHCDFRFSLSEVSREIALEP